MTRRHFHGLILLNIIQVVTNTIEKLTDWPVLATHWNPSQNKRTGSFPSLSASFWNPPALRMQLGTKGNAYIILLAQLIRKELPTSKIGAYSACIFLRRRSLSLDLSRELLISRLRLLEQKQVVIVHSWGLCVRPTLSNAPWNDYDNAAWKYRWHINKTVKRITCAIATRRLSTNQHSSGSPTDLCHHGLCHDDLFRGLLILILIAPWNLRIAHETKLGSRKIYLLLSLGPDIFHVPGIT